ncbi:peptide chain release factor N(5)-glutamine methyltransferase [Marinilongibacter aquaticus]|uniref:peptide chain release factor N(5)-glutamine methyltransferase n=1 Tax=Marinilongibacter aquaticus TaxID=2975157 RepID=UPI0021BDCB0C|nr:peptide chain release factor N(5)-glutamine methyltransferase [Marinilongibacter aquaticus]UBM60871.1 peptide chain release factor N(5)-glutamine methyltransferase [Marinilongibacter aquaticus]
MPFAQELYKESLEKLQAAGFGEAQSTAYRLLEDGFQVSKIDIVLNKPVEIDRIAHAKAIERILDHEPLQQVLGFTYFLNRKFAVNREVLIPRPETEELVLWAKELKLHAPNILDVGTGSGCIAVSLALEYPEANVKALDISEKALETAKNNALANGSKVEFMQCNFLKDGPSGPFDLIVSNPPYIRELEATEMEKNVLEFEPHTALFVPDTKPLLFYEALANFGLQQEETYVLVEINSYLGLETQSLFLQKGYKEVQLRQDFYGKDRFVLAKKSRS